jgi:hypothetical protein
MKVEEAITHHWGERCDDYEEGCPVCDAWHEYDALPNHERNPLTDEEILTYRHMIDWTAEWSYINFARAIEAAHGIKGEA